jgi:hypothetical protein
VFCRVFFRVLPWLAVPCSSVCFRGQTFGVRPWLAVPCSAVTQLVSKPQRLRIRARHLVGGSRGRRVEKRRPPQRGSRPGQVRDLPGSHAAGALYRLRRSRESEVAANETPNPDRRALLGFETTKEAFPCSSVFFRG